MKLKRILLQIQPYLQLERHSPFTLVAPSPYNIIWFVSLDPLISPKENNPITKSYDKSTMNKIMRLCHVPPPQGGCLPSSKV